MRALKVNCGIIYNSIPKYFVEFVKNNYELFIYLESEVVKLINSAIEEREQQVLLGALQMPEAQLPAIQPAAAPLYFNELVNMKEEKQVFHRFNIKYGI